MLGNKYYIPKISEESQMNENSKNAIDLAYNGDIANMQTAIEDAIKDKILTAFEYKRQEVARELMNTNEAHCCDKKELSAKQKKEMDVDDDEDIDEKDLKALRTKKLKKEEVEDLEEKLSPSMGVDKYIHDFVHSDNPKFEGKSKKERIKQALAAYYSAKRGEK